MTLHQFSCPDGLEGASAGSVVVVEGPEARHALGAHRLRAGDRLRLADGRGRVAVAEVSSESSTGRDPVLVSTVEEVWEEPHPLPTIRLVQALSKNDRDLAAIEMATELGVSRVVPWESDRSIAKWPAGKAEKSAAKWAGVLAAAAKQARSPWTPDLEPHASSRQLTRLVAEWVQSGESVLVLHEDATTLLREWCRTCPGEGAALERVTLIVGPEGGITPRECEQLVSAGGVLVGLGPRILRASSAGPVAMTILDAILGGVRANHADSDGIDRLTP